MFVNREEELAFLDSVLERNRPGTGQFILLFGRRRVGKTSLLLRWAGQQDIPNTYWAAEKEPAALQRRKLYARLLGVRVAQAPIFDSWAELWEAAAAYLGDRRHILILDETPYASEADPAMLSALQHAWDHYFKNSQLLLVLCGSQVRIMEALQSQQSPLFGRLTGQWHLQPLPFSSLRTFFPGWTAEERVTAYAMIGGVPAYLEWLDPTLSLEENIRQIVLSPGYMFLAEPTFLLYDEVREPQSYLAVLNAIGAGHHTLADISNACLISKSHLSSYLSRLQALRFVERRLPATLTPAQQRRSKRGRYHLNDPYFRFYFRFLAPHQDRLPFDAGPALGQLDKELRAFVGQTAFEELSRLWTFQQGKRGQLPFAPEQIGSHWSHRVQVDVVAVNWQSRDILLGECKWGQKKVGRAVIEDLIARKRDRVRRDLTSTGKQWRFHFSLFAQAALTAGARKLAKDNNVLVVDLPRLDKDLGNKPS
jgi:AAA+ ATPase superfamily predicted ATPase